MFCRSFQALFIPNNNIIIYITTPVALRPDSHRTFCNYLKQHSVLLGGAYAHFSGESPVRGNVFLLWSPEPEELLLLVTGLLGLALFGRRFVRD